MLAATEVKMVMRGSKKKRNRNTYDIFSIKRGVTRKFHVVVVQNNDKEMYKKRNIVLHPAKLFFFL